MRTIQFCGLRGGKTRFEVHHNNKELNKIIEEYNIKSMSDVLNCKELWDVGNGVLLCFDCHQLTKYGRKKT